MSVRLLCLLLLAVVLSVNGLNCLSGYYVKYGNPNDSPKFNSYSSVPCKAGITACIKEKIYATGLTGKVVAAIRYDCDQQSQCAANYMANAQNCQQPWDLFIGDMCCCNTDNCNVDVTGSSSALLFLLPISLLLLFFHN